MIVRCPGPGGMVSIQASQSFVSGAGFAIVDSLFEDDCARIRHRPRGYNVTLSSEIPAGCGLERANDRANFETFDGYNGKLSCFLPGISTVFPRSIASARATRRRVA